MDCVGQWPFALNQIACTVCSSTVMARSDWDTVCYGSAGALCWLLVMLLQSSYDLSKGTLVSFG